MVASRNIEDADLDSTIAPNPESAEDGSPEGASVHASSASPSATYETQGDSPAADDLELLARGSTIGRYLVLERLGAGAMGVAYAAYDPELDRKIALKLIRPSPGGGNTVQRRARLVREAKAIAKVSNPNVVGIFDVGLHEGQVFMAMEYLSGGTLTQWLAAKKRPWREVLAMFVEVGRGLAGAHAEALVHRDFKPDNVLLDKNGAPKVVDFGLVRLTTARDLMESGQSLEEERAAAGAARALAANDDVAALTRTGALTGTPAYMAPEQFLGKAVDARTDQFAFCVALLEALYGERPFEGKTVLALSTSVTSGTVREAPKESDVPGWLRRAALRGLNVDPDKRYGGLDDLLALLAHDPALKLRRRVGVIAAAVVVVAALVTIQHRAERRRREIDRQVAEHVGAAERAHADARANVAKFVELGQRAYRAYDAQLAEEGDRLWDDARAALADAVVGYQGADEHLDSTLALDRRADLEARWRGLLEEQVLAAERTRTPALAADVRKKLAAEPAEAAFLAPRGALTLAVSPAGAAVALERYVPGKDGLLAPTAVPSTATMTAAAPQALDVGSYRLTVTWPRVRIRYPFTLERDERLDLSLRLGGEAPPDGVSLVPAGRFLFGDADEELRQAFLKTVPIHEVTTGSYAIGRTEVTFSDWIRYLEADGHVDDQRLWPNVAEARGSTLGGSVRLTRAHDTWTLVLAPSTVEYRAARGEPIRYGRRKDHATQDWLSMPVTGVSAQEIAGYLAWLDRTGRVQGARLCTEREWERGARGADDRLFPHGNTLRPADANHDATYGRAVEAFGPDEVCAHHRSDSPFDLCDMAGNVLELTTSSLRPQELVIRGGGYYFFRNSERSTNRELFVPAARSAHVGFRVCADGDRWVTAEARSLRRNDSGPFEGGKGGVR